MRNVSDESCRENQNTFCVQQILSENRAVCEIMCENIVERGRPQMAIWRMRNACWITEAIDAHLEYVVLIIVFPPRNSG